MKKQLITLSLAVFTLAGQAFAQQPNTQISGKLDGLPKDEWIYLSGLTNRQKDSVQQTDKGFKFELNIPEGEGDFYILQVGKRDASGQMNGAFLYLEKGKLTINSKTAQIKEAKFAGGKLADYYNQFQNRPKATGLDALYKQYEEAQASKKTDKLTELRTAIDAKNAEQKELDRVFVLKHKKSPGIAYPMFFSLRDRNNLASVDELLQQVSPQAKNNIPVKNIEHSIKTEKLTGIGRTALPFAQADTSGKLISLSDFKGKYVLIDFWASWCVPCRVENPHVVTAYQQFKNKNFTVLGISFDNPGQHSRWMEAIHADNLQWTQVSDLKGWKNEVGVLYDIKSIPSNLLLDPNGTIIAKNLRGDKLQEKLEELLGTPQLDKNTFVLTGKVANTGQARAFHIQYEGADGKTVKDSVRIFNGVFSYIGKIASPVEVRAYYTKDKEGAPQSFDSYLSFYVEPGIISLTGDTGQPKAFNITGSKVQDENVLFNSLTAEELNLLKPISEEYNKKSMAYGKLKKEGADEAVLNAKLEECEQLRADMAPYYKAMQEKNLAYMRKHPNSIITANRLRGYFSSLSLEELQGFYGKMNDEIRNSAAGQELKNEIKNLQGGSPGGIAADFSGPDINGKLLKLSDYRGQYVLIDFWASWCVPCRKGNPHLLQLYSKYKKKGFEIIGVSDDDSNHAAWHKAVEQDKIGVWKHVLRGLKKMENGRYDKSEDKSEAYGIHTLPSKILVGPDGVIIGRYASGAGTDADLDAKLKEVFKF
ncbi:redoxin domain-containing protein [Sphingobacterium yanglingense]|uniref:Peroxiredoxin n=1 Tax=Sphingobacterium yanglingense TaxID=1437280 RepID=A0A4R6WSK8_9SPHI|nr:redoxin domain-containing protein [Sphingobacterium yanglingense]TDQ81712.1 peroxiredoxin [Sphingobacterium yanglingense]